MSNAKLEQAVACVALGRAHAAVGRGDDVEALVRLLDAWGAVRDPVIADHIDIVSHRALRLRPAVTDETQWLSRTREADVVELGRLLDKLPRRPSLLVSGLESLLDRRPDPRLASALMRLRASSRGRLSANLATGLVSLRHIDPAYLSTLRAERDEGAGPDAELDAAIAHHEALARVRAIRLDDRGQAWMRVLDGREDPPSDDLHVQLLSKIAANPRELGHRQVYADYALQRGDVHGEFIALQLRAEQGSIGDTGRARLVELRDAYTRDWLGNLTEVFDLDHVAFWAGFGVRGELVGLDGARVVGPREAQWLETHPGLATFQVLGGAPRRLARALGLV